MPDTDYGRLRAALVSVQEIAAKPINQWESDAMRLAMIERLCLRVLNGPCVECDGSGNEMCDSMTMFGIPGGFAPCGPCPACGGTGAHIDGSATDTEADQ